MRKFVGARKDKGRVILQAWFLLSLSFFISFFFTRSLFDCWNLTQFLGLELLCRVESSLISIKKKEKTNKQQTYDSEKPSHKTLVPRWSQSLVFEVEGTNVGSIQIRDTNLHKMSGMVHFSVLNKIVLVW